MRRLHKKKQHGSQTDGKYLNLLVFTKMKTNNCKNLLENYRNGNFKRERIWKGCGEIYILWWESKFVSHFGK